jgi:hypothetical protein
MTGAELAKAAGGAVETAICLAEACAAKPRTCRLLDWTTLVLIWDWRTGSPHFVVNLLRISVSYQIMLLSTHLSTCPVKPVTGTW